MIFTQYILLNIFQNELTIILHKNKQHIIVVYHVESEYNLGSFRYNIVHYSINIDFVDLRLNR